MVTRFSLALILLFIAPSAWGQVQNGPFPRDGELCVVQNKVLVCGGGTLTNSTGTFTPPPSCEPGWSLVMDASQKPQCAWVLKEPIYK